MNDIALPDANRIFETLRRTETPLLSPHSFNVGLGAERYLIAFDLASPLPDMPCRLSLVHEARTSIRTHLSRNWFYESTGILLPERLNESSAGGQFLALNRLISDHLEVFLQGLGFREYWVDAMDTDHHESALSSNYDVAEVSVFNVEDSLLADPLLCFEIPRTQFVETLSAARRLSKQWHQNTLTFSKKLKVDFFIDLLSWPVDDSKLFEFEAGGLLKVVQKKQFYDLNLPVLMRSNEKLAYALNLHIKEHQMEFTKESEPLELGNELLNHQNRLNFRLAGTSLSLADLASLKNGDHIAVDLVQWPNVEIMHGNTVLGKGELVMFNQEVAVQITQLINQPESSSSHAIL